MFQWFRDFWFPLPKVEEPEFTPPRPLAIYLVPDDTHKHMFWLVYPDDVKSADFYNLTWAKEHKRNIIEGRSYDTV